MLPLGHSLVIAYTINNHGLLNMELLYFLPFDMCDPG